MGPPASGTAQRRGLGKGIFGVPGLWELQPSTIQAIGRGFFFCGVAGEKLLESVRRQP